MWFVKTSDPRRGTPTPPPGIFTGQSITMTERKPAGSLYFPAEQTGKTCNRRCLRRLRPMPPHSSAIVKDDLEERLEHLHKAEK